MHLRYPGIARPGLAIIPLGPRLPSGSSSRPGDLPRERGGTGTLVPLFGLAPHGVYRAPAVAGGAVRSYRTVSPLPSFRKAVCSLWHFPSRRRDRGLPGMPPVWSSDFPLRFLGAITWPARSRGDSTIAARSTRPPPPARRRAKVSLPLCPSNSPRSTSSILDVGEAARILRDPSAPRAEHLPERVGSSHSRRRRGPPRELRSHSPRRSRTGAAGSDLPQDRVVGAARLRVADRETPEPRGRWRPPIEEDDAEPAPAQAGGDLPTRAARIPPGARRAAGSSIRYCSREVGHGCSGASDPRRGAAGGRRGPDSRARPAAET